MPTSIPRRLRIGMALRLSDIMTSRPSLIICGKPGAVQMDHPKRTGSMPRKNCDRAPAIDHCGATRSHPARRGAVRSHCTNGAADLCEQATMSKPSGFPTRHTVPGRQVRGNVQCDIQPEPWRGRSHLRGPRERWKRSAMLLVSPSTGGGVKVRRLSCSSMDERTTLALVSRRPKRWRITLSNNAWPVRR